MLISSSFPPADAACSSFIVRFCLGPLLVVEAVPVGELLLRAPRPHAGGVVEHARGALLAPSVRSFDSAGLEGPFEPLLRLRPVDGHAVPIFKLRRGDRFVLWPGVVVPLFEVATVFDVQLFAPSRDGVGGVHDRQARRAGRVDALDRHEFVDP